MSLSKMNKMSKIAFLKPQASFPIKARVLSKGTIHRPPNRIPDDEYLELIVCDDTGSIYVQVKGPYLWVIEQMIKPDATYLLIGFEIIFASCDGHWWRNHLELVITRPSQVYECKDVETPALDTIADLREHRLFSCRERFYRNMNLLLVQVFPNGGTYLACPDNNCRKSILGEGNNGQFLCNRGCQQVWDRRVVRYCLRLRFQDTWGMMNAVCYDDAAVAFTGMTAEEFRNMAINEPQRLRRKSLHVAHRFYDIRVQIKLEQLQFQPWTRLSFIIRDIRLA